MNRAFPFAEIDPSEEHWRVLAEVALPDEDDRHVLAAAVAAEATVLCTSNVRTSRSSPWDHSASRFSPQTNS